MLTVIKYILICIVAIIIIQILSQRNIYAQVNPVAGSEINIVAKFMQKVQTAGEEWKTIFQEIAKKLFILTLTIEIALFGIKIALQRTQLTDIIVQFVTLLIFAGFIAAVISNYPDWSDKVLNIQNDIGSPASAPKASPLQALTKAIDILLYLSEDYVGITNIPASLCVLFTIIVLICVFLLILGIKITILAEFYILGAMCLLLIGLGGTKIFKDYAVNAMKYVFAVALKLLCLQMIINIGVSVFDSLVAKGIPKEGLVANLALIIGTSLLMLFLAKVLPTTFAGILQGSQINAGNPVGDMAKAAGKAALMGTSQAVGHISDLGSAYKVAGAQGKTGMGRVSQAFQNWNEARTEAKSNPNTTKGQLQAQYSKAMLSRSASNSEPIESDSGPAKGQQGSSTAGSESNSAEDSKGSDNISKQESPETGSGDSSSPSSPASTADNSSAPTSKGADGPSVTSSSPSSPASTADNSSAPTSKGADGPSVTSSVPSSPASTADTSSAPTSKGADGPSVTSSSPSSPASTADTSSAPTSKVADAPSVTSSAPKISEAPDSTSSATTSDNENSNSLLTKKNKSE